jgi:hypothetical protein
MSPEPDNFEPLSRLLTLKRHEQPPPGYFDGFSRQVIIRLRAGDRGDQARLATRELAEVPWLQRFWTLCTTNPALAGAFGVAVCSLLVAGVAYSNNSEGSASQDVGQALASGTEFNLQLANQSSGFVSSTNGFMPDQARPSLFDEFRTSQTQPSPVRVNTVSR